MIGIVMGLRNNATMRSWLLSDDTSQLHSLSTSPEHTNSERPLRRDDPLSIHVASARLFGERMTSQAFTFVSADRQQTTVAEALGIETCYVGS